MVKYIAIMSLLFCVIFPLSAEEPAEETVGETTEETASGLPSRFGLIFSYAGENFGFPIFNSPSNPGGMIGVEFSLSGKRGYAYIQCINLGYVYHIGLLHSLFLNTLCYMKWWIKDQATIGVYLGAGIIDVFYEGEKYVFDDGMYKKAEFTFGNIYPYFPFGLSLGYDLSRITVVPLEVVLRYECSIQIGFHEAVPAMLHVAFYGGFVWHF